MVRIHQYIVPHIEEGATGIVRCGRVLVGRRVEDLKSDETERGLVAASFRALEITTAIFTVNST